MEHRHTRLLECPEPIRDQITRFVSALRQIHSGGLTGVYLHGSLAMGCFNPELSDLDVLVATAKPMLTEMRRQTAECLLDLSKNPSPIEVSFLTAEDRSRWQHPLPYDFHYSEDWRERFVTQLGDGSWRKWQHPEKGDVDLAAHLTVLHARGLTVLGETIATAFPEVPKEDYLAAILADVDKESCLYNAERNPVYIILNLCRVYAYLCRGRVESKEEGGAWAVQALPSELAPVVEKALARYRGGVPTDVWDLRSVLDFTESMRGLITKARSS